MVVLVVLGGLASADDKLVQTYEGQIVISPDPVPKTLDELRKFVTSNAAKDRRYELIKGPPWEINLVGFLSKDPGTTPVTLVFIDAADKKQTPLQSIDVSSKRRMVIVKTVATVAAGFEATKTYVVQLMLKSTVLAKTELTLRN